MLNRLIASKLTMTNPQSPSEAKKRCRYYNEGFVPMVGTMATTYMHAVFVPNKVEAVDIQRSDADLNLEGQIDKITITTTRDTS